MYFPQTLEQLETIRKDSLRLVNKWSAISGAAAIVPLPGIDISADIAIMMQLLNEINIKFGLTEQQIGRLDPERQKVLLVIIASLGNELIGKPLTAAMVRSALKKTTARLATKQAGKFMPVIGQAVSAGISFAAMKYLGNHHVSQCYQITLQYMQNIDTRFVDDVIEISPDFN